MGERQNGKRTDGREGYEDGIFYWRNDGRRQDLRGQMPDGAAGKQRVSGRRLVLDGEPVPCYGGNKTDGDTEHLRAFKKFYRLYGIPKYYFLLGDARTAHH